MQSFHWLHLWLWIPEQSDNTHKETCVWLTEMINVNNVFGISRHLYLKDMIVILSPSSCSSSRSPSSRCFVSVAICSWEADCALMFNYVSSRPLVSEKPTKSCSFYKIITKLIWLFEEYWMLILAHELIFVFVFVCVIICICLCLYYYLYLIVFIFVIVFLFLFVFVFDLVMTTPHSGHICQTF